MPQSSQSLGHMSLDPQNPPWEPIMTSKQQGNFKCMQTRGPHCPIMPWLLELGPTTHSPTWFTLSLSFVILEEGRTILFLYNFNVILFSFLSV